MLLRRRSTQVYRITGARQGLADDVRGRQRRYVISMLIRTVAVILTVLLWNVQRPLAIGMLVLGAVLPYVAVVAANAGRENASAIPSAFRRTLTGPMLPPSGEPAPQDQHGQQDQPASAQGRAAPPQDQPAPPQDEPAPRPDEPAPRHDRPGPAPQSPQASENPAAPTTPEAPGTGTRTSRSAPYKTADDRS